jgi:hypothetical protein
MTEFSPILFSVAPIDTSDHESLIQKVADALTKDTVPLDTGFMFNFGALIFVNKHPEMTQVIVEVQALSEESRDKAISIINEIPDISTSGPLQWMDVTTEALAYHASLKTEEV